MSEENASEKQAEQQEKTEKKKKTEQQETTALKNYVNSDPLAGPHLLDAVKRADRVERVDVGR